MGNDKLSETIKCPACGGIMSIYKIDDKPETETHNRSKKSIIYAEEEEETIRYKCVFYKCENCYSILKDSLMRRIIFLKRPKL